MYNPNNIAHESTIALSSSARFYALAAAAEEAANTAYWCEFGWEEDDGPSPPQRYVEFVAGRRRAARILLEKAEGLRRSGY